MSIRRRIILSYIAILGISCALIIYLTLQDLMPRYSEAVEETLVDTSQILAHLIASQSDGKRIDFTFLENTFASLETDRFRADIYGKVKTTSDLRVYVTDSKGILLYDSQNIHPPGTNYSLWNDVFLTLQGKYGARSTRIDPEDNSTGVQYVGAPIRKNGEILGVVTVAKPKRSVSVFVEVAKRRFMMTVFWIALMVVIVGVLLSGWITRPIEKLIAYARAVQKGEKAELPPLEKNELGAMGKALEDMRLQLDGKQYVENYIQTLTHEIKSPLSAIRGASELLTEEMPAKNRKTFLDNIQVESRRLQDIVNRLLELSALERKSSLVDKREIELGFLIGEVAASFEPQLRKKDIAVQWSADEEVFILGDRFLIRHALANLLQNAIEFSPENGRIELSLEKVPPDKVAISVRDYGTGIPEFALNRIYDRFYSLERPETGKKSSGLGLPFVKEVVQLHNGTLEIKNQKKGILARMTFPAT